MSTLRFVPLFSARPRRAKTHLLSLACAAALLLNALPASAINIILSYNAGASESPAFDADGSQLTAIMQAVEARYQDIFEDSHTITINYWWEDLNGLLGDHDLVSQSGGRETEANLRFDTRAGLGGALRSYFFDPTPALDEEFNMTQVLYRDLSGADQAQFFNGAPPSLFEAGYKGTAPGGSAAVGLIDLLSLAFHETGHSLGMSSSNNSTVAETGDNDYDIDPDFVRNAVMATGVYTGGTDSIGHLDNDQALMFGGGISITGARVRPSAADLLSMATGHSYVDVDLERKDILGGSDWNTAGNWEGNQVPGAADDAFVRTGGNISLSAAGFAENLLLAESTDILTNANKLDVGATLTIQHDGTPEFPQVFVEAGGEVEAGDLVINGGELDMTGGLADIQDDLTLAIGGGRAATITGNGTIDVAGTLVNDGLIRPDGGTLTFISAAASPWNLDGSGGSGDLDASVGNVNFASGGLTDDFDGTITVGATHVVTFAVGWELGVGGELMLNGGADFANRAEVDGGAMNLRGAITVDGYAELDAAVNLFATANVSVPNSNDRLNLGSTPSDTVTSNGPTITGNGLISQEGNLIVAADTTIDAQKYNWDGDGATTTTINAGVLFEINSLTIESTLNDGFDGTINLNGGQLEVNTGSIIDPGGGIPLFLPVAWSLDVAGDLNLTNNGDVMPGSPLDVSGQINATGTGNEIQSPVIFRSTAQVSVPFGANLELDGTTTYRGGAFTGNGALRQSGPATVAESTTVDIATFDLDGLVGVSAVTTINPGVTFVINALQIDAGDPSIEGFDGTLNVESGVLAVNTGTVLDPGGGPPIFLPSPWRMQGILNLTNTGGGTPLVNGSTMIVEDTINATGGASEINAAVVFAAGTINVDAVSTLRQDGTFTHQGGTIAILAGGRMQTNGTATFQAGAVVQVAGTLETNGTTHFQGGMYTGAGLVQLDGPTTVDAATTMAVDRVDLDGLAGTTQLTLNDDLTLNVMFVDNGNNLYNGTLNINSSADQLAVNTPAAWTMAGTLNIDSGTNLTLPSIAGQAFTLGGTANIDGGTRFDARTDITGDVVFADADSRLALGGGDLATPNTFAAAATASGLGVLRVNTGRALRIADGAVVRVKLENGGQLEVGASPGAASVQAFEQDATGTWVVEIGGLASGTEYDVLNVLGLADLDGRLNVDLRGGFMPGLCDMFTVMTYTAVMGDFASYVDLDLGNFLTLHPMLLVDRLVLRAQPEFDGDINLDGTVNIFDVNAVSANWGAAGPQGDANCDGTVNIFDVNLISANWGAGGGGAAAVPEPAGLVLLLFGAALAPIAIRRRAKKA